MRLLLDTHLFLWLLSGDSRLPARFDDAITDPANDVFLSVVSIWEAVIKHALGKLSLPEPPAQYPPRQRIAHGIASLPVEERALVHLASLPMLHADPFDRLLVAQALDRDCAIMTVDDAVRAYPAKSFA